jgi:hypothetical protein
LEKDDSNELIAVLSWVIFVAVGFASSRDMETVKLLFVANVSIAVSNSVTWLALSVVPFDIVV